MAKAIDLPITGLESDKSWERYKGSRVREYLQKKSVLSIGLTKTR